MQKTLYIGNLASHQVAGEVERLLAKVGKVLHIKMMVHDDFVRRHVGFAIVEMESAAEAIEIVRSLHGTVFHGCTLEVRPATAMEESAAGSPRMFGTMNMSDDGLSPGDV